MTESTQQCLIVFVGLVAGIAVLGHFAGSCQVAVEEQKRKAYGECYAAGKTAAECKLQEIAR